ncbi:MAG TPA: hypothetical protein VHY83_08235 [Solirubrobacteraceae bacterium]|jgi:hypothetical protein|nr:hypothetical protein [Solirubrobacteraceae bacterium]
MPRIIVTTDSSQKIDDGSTLLDERVQSVHISTEHAAAQLVERLAWAISDAESAEQSGRRRAPAGPEQDADAREVPRARAGGRARRPRRPGSSQEVGSARRALDPR